MDEIVGNVTEQLSKPSGATLAVEKGRDAEQIWFPQMLRAIAVLSVVFEHYLAVFVNSNPVIVALAYTRPVTIDPNIFSRIGLWLETWHFNFGTYGVAVFFMISGFVIPISIDRIGSGMFLLRRLFRIYPPYIIGLLLTFITIYLYTSHIGKPFPYTIKDYVINAALVRDWFWIASIDGVNWTLEVEIKFYLVCAFVAWVASLRSPKTLIITCMVMLLFMYITSGMYDFLLANLFYLYKFAYILSSDFTYLTFMFIGTCFYNLYMGYWSRRLFFAVVGTLLIFFLIEISLFPVPEWRLQILSNYSFGLGTFVVAYAFRGKLAYNKVLDFFARISYPIYILHAVIGYILLTFLVTHNVNFFLSVVIVFCIVIVLSYVLHKLVELPANKLGKRVAKLVNEVKL